MPFARRSPCFLALMLLMGSLLVVPNLAAAQGPPDPVRFATFNASLNRGTAGLALADLSAKFNPLEPDLGLRARRQQAANVAETTSTTTRGRSAA